MLRALLSLLVTFTSALQQPRTMSATTKRLKSTPVDVELVPVGASEVAHVHSLEAASYPADEAASLESFVLRQREAGAYFRKCMVGGELAGFICGTRCEAFTEASMATHAAAGPVLAIHSVVTAPAFRRRGVALEGLRQYAEAVAGDGVESVKLIAKAPLLGLYARAGFAVDGLSAIVHGKDPWFQCTRDATTVACRARRSERSHVLPHLECNQRRWQPHCLSGRLLVLFLEMSLNYQTVFNTRRYDVPHTRS